MIFLIFNVSSWKHFKRFSLILLIMLFTKLLKKSSLVIRADNNYRHIKKKVSIANKKIVISCTDNAINFHKSKKRNDLDYTHVAMKPNETSSQTFTIFLCL